MLRSQIPILSSPSAMRLTNGGGSGIRGKRRTTDDNEEGWRARSLPPSREEVDAHAPLRSGNWVLRSGGRLQYRRSRGLRREGARLGLGYLFSLIHLFHLFSYIPSVNI